MNFFIKFFIFSIVVIFFIQSPSFAQDTELPYTAEAYFREVQHSVYQTILEKIKMEEALSNNEIKFYKDYNAYLVVYYNNLSDDEKNRYVEYNVQWLEYLWLTPS